MEMYDCMDLFTDIFRCEVREKNARRRLDFSFLGLCFQEDVRREVSVGERCRGGEEEE